MYKRQNLYGSNSANSFDTNLNPLEDPRGYHSRFTVGSSYLWRDPKISVKASFRNIDVVRGSILSPELGGSQNLVDVNTKTWHLDGSWGFQADKNFTVGIDLIDVRGHYDPGGLYNAFAIRTGSTDFENISSVQAIPFVEFDWDVSEKTQWNLLVRHYDTNDRLGSEVAAGRSFDSIGSTIHPFAWSGWQVSSGFTLKF